MSRFVLITIAHVKDIGGLRRVVAPLREGGAIYRPNAGTPGEVAGALTGALTGLRTRGSGENRVAPRSSAKPSRSQPRVPFQSTYTSFGTPAATRLVPPRVPRVRDI